MKEELIKIIQDSTDTAFLQAVTDFVINYRRSTPMPEPHTKSNPSWREDAPSEKQIGLIRKIQERNHLTARMPATKGEAHDMIDRYTRGDFSEPISNSGQLPTRDELFNPNDPF